MNRVRHTLNVDGAKVALVVRRHARARRMILRIDPQGTGAVVTIPAAGCVQDAINMATRKVDWIKRQLAKQPCPVVFEDGAKVPLLDQVHVVRHVADLRGLRGLRGVCQYPGPLPEIHVGGAIEHLPRRLTDWLKVQARGEISPRAIDKAAEISQRVSRVTIRDTRSRWGSCGAGGTLNFSWRLVMAPDYVLDYVVAHEVAHLRHRDHGARFWQLTNSLTPRMDDARAWLNAFGRDLHRYGPQPHP